MSQVASLQAGTEPIPGFRLLRRLGAGGFGEVWEVKGPAGEALALKFLSNNAQRATSQEIRSLQAIRRLRHAHLIRIDEVWCHQNFIAISMELANGSLADLLEVYQSDYGMPIPVEHTCQYLTQAAKALDFLNARQHQVNGMRVAVQHCDIKPSNLLLVGDTVKVADFGLSGWISTTTKQFRRAGTLDYCPPEVFQGILSLQSDQFALAVTYCQLRAGRLPFRDTPPSFEADYVRPDPDLSMLGDAEKPIVARALDVQPHHRWPTCGEFMYQLHRAVRQSPQSVAATT